MFPKPSDNRDERGVGERQRQSNSTVVASDGFAGADLRVDILEPILLDESGDDNLGGGTLDVRQGDARGTLESIIPGCRKVCSSWAPSAGSPGSARANIVRFSDPAF